MCLTGRPQVLYLLSYDYFLQGVMIVQSIQRIYDNIIQWHSTEAFLHCFPLLSQRVWQAHTLIK